MSATKPVVAVLASVYAWTKARAFLLARAEKSGTRVGPEYLGWFTSWLLYRYSLLMGVRLASENDFTPLDDAKKYMIVWHPHGFLAWGAMFIFGKMAVTGQPGGREWFAMVAPVLFKIPIFGDALLMVNARRVAKPVVEGLLNQGRQIAIQPGGVKEQLQSRHDQEIAFFPANLGFIRMAIKFQRHLLPVYIFGENQIFRRLEGLDGVFDKIFRSSGVPVPALSGKLGLPFLGLMPRSGNIHVRWGRHIDPGPAEDEPSDSRVEEVFGRYLAEIQRIFDENAFNCLPPEVAAKGLLIKRVPGAGQLPRSKL
uniref:Acyltransferase n=1 Tax=Noctiluca scintillans TaxID=2966 RepID=A0A7S1F4Z8_NOCSC